MFCTLDLFVFTARCDELHFNNAPRIEYEVMLRSFILTPIHLVSSERQICQKDTGDFS